MKIHMVDLANQYNKISTEIDNAILNTVRSADFINGKEVKEFSQDLALYNKVKNVIPCANGTDALQLAMMALGLKRGDEVIVPAFTYVATAEVAGLLGIVPVMIDVDRETFNLDVNKIRIAITKKTRAIIPVHLFGQCADMEAILKIAKEFNLFVIEDAAQAMGADYIFSDGTVKKAGTIGDIGCTSFFPSKNLGCYGDGGAIFTNSDEISENLKMISNHGQRKKYYHSVIGINSRLDSVQAAILRVKLRYLDDYCDSRINAADAYDKLLSELDTVITPKRISYSTHVFHQYTLRILNGARDDLKKYLDENGIPSMIYYPVPLIDQEAFKDIGIVVDSIPVCRELCDSCLSLPMHTEMTCDMQEFIISSIKNFFK